MKMDMECIRDILLTIEEKHEDVALYDLEVKDYNHKKIAYHCKVLYQEGYVDGFNQQFAGNELYSFGVGGLTWKGNELLEKIRNNDTWSKTKKEIAEKGLPKIISIIDQISSTIVKAMTEGAIKGIIGQ